MVTIRNNVFNCAANFLRGRKCIFCGSFKVYKTRRGYVKCGKCKRQKSLKQLRKEIAIITGFYQLQPAYRLAIDLGIDYQSVMRVYHRVREAIYHVAELEAGKLKGEIEIDEAYFGGRRKGRRGRGASGKSIVFGLLERDGMVYTKVVEQVTADDREVARRLLRVRLLDHAAHAKEPAAVPLRHAVDRPRPRLRSCWGAGGPAPLGGRGAVSPLLPCSPAPVRAA